MKRPTVLIVGVGLIGGSIGRALRRRRLARVIGLGRRWSTLRQAKRLGAVDEISRDPASASRADWIILCTPVDRILPGLRQIRPFLKRGAWVTDAGSVKAALVRGMARELAGTGARFAGSHPLCGSHETGVGNSDARMLEGAVCVVVPGDRRPIGPLVSFWRRLGARPLIMSGAAHDEALALTSHLPHLVAHAFMHAVRRRKDRGRMAKLTAGSFRDATRVAASDPAQWRAILFANRRFVRRQADRFAAELRRLVRLLGKPGLSAELRRSQRARQAMARRRP